MRVTKSYEDLPMPEKREKAMRDIKAYLGPKKFQELNNKFISAGKIDSGQFEFICMVGGIEGYPVQAWYENLYGVSNG